MPFFFLFCYSTDIKIYVYFKCICRQNIVESTVGYICVYRKSYCIHMWNTTKGEEKLRMQKYLAAFRSLVYRLFGWDVIYNFIRTR